MIRPEKAAAVEEITQIFQEANGVFITDFKGLDVEQISELRSKCREDSVHYVVVKNTLARIAARNAGLTDLESSLQGPSAIAYSYDDPAAPARVITRFAKTAEKPSIKVSLFEGVFYGPDQVKAISELPSKQELLGKIVSGLNSPIQGLVCGLSGMISQLARTLNAVKEKKESE